MGHATHLGHGWAEAAVDNTETNERDCVPIKRFMDTETWIAYICMS